MSFDAARSPSAGALLGEMLLADGLIGAADLERALELQGRVGGRLGSVLMRIGALSEDNLIHVLGRQLQLPVMGSEVPMPDEDAVRQAAAATAGGLDWMLDQHLLVWHAGEDSLYCAARDPLLPSLHESMRHAFPGKAVLRVCD